MSVLTLAMQAASRVETTVEGKLRIGDAQEKYRERLGNALCNMTCIVGPLGPVHPCSSKAGRQARSIPVRCQ